MPDTDPTDDLALTMPFEATILPVDEPPAPVSKAVAALLAKAAPPD